MRSGKRLIAYVRSDWVKYNKNRLSIKISVFGIEYRIVSHILLYRMVMTTAGKHSRVMVYITQNCDPYTTIQKHNLKRLLIDEWKGVYRDNRDRWNGGDQ